MAVPRYPAEAEMAGYRFVRIGPGEYHATGRAEVVSTLLGSCVAACLYDPVNRVIGMNHFMLSNPQYSRTMPVCTTEAGRYGIHAMELLINAMMRIGAQRRHLQAKAFGGGAVFGEPRPAGGFACVGEVNCRFVREFLETERIPLAAQDLGGTRGRVIYFSSKDFSVYVRPVRRLAGSPLQQQEQLFWRREVAQHERAAPEPELWG